jgi:uncharacterized glyoxalase superfamily protein PhnB
MGKEVIPIERIAHAILVIRGEKVMLDSAIRRDHWKLE